MIQTGQLIFYDNEEMICYNVEHFLWQDCPLDLLDVTALTDEVQSFVNSSMARTTVAYLKKETEIIKLDPTTMKRIARYNLEKENETLLKEIENHKKVIADLKQKEDVLHDRFRNAISTFREIMERGYCEVENEDEDEYESEWE